MNRPNLAEQVRLSLGDEADEFDIPAIVVDLIMTFGPSSLDTIPRDVFLSVARTYDRKRK